MPLDPAVQEWRRWAEVDASAKHTKCAQLSLLIMLTDMPAPSMQERRRRAEVEGRLEEIGKECSSIRLQLRRLGVK